MDGNTVLTGVAKNTDSGIILAMIVIAVVVTVISIPLYRMTIAYDREKRKTHIQREGQLIEVIQQNTSVISELKILLVDNNDTQKQVKMEYHKRIDDIENAVEEHNEKLIEVLTLLKTRQCLTITNIHTEKGERP